MDVLFPGLLQAFLMNRFDLTEEKVAVLIFILCCVFFQHYYIGSDCNVYPSQFKKKTNVKFSQRFRYFLWYFFYLITSAALDHDDLNMDLYEEVKKRRKKGIIFVANHNLAPI